MSESVLFTTSGFESQRAETIAKRFERRTSGTLEGVLRAGLMATLRDLQFAMEDARGLIRADALDRARALLVDAQLDLSDAAALLNDYERERSR